MKHRLAKYVFAILLLISFYLAFLSLQNKEWESLTATISLTIAIISGWIAYESFYNQSLARRPQIILKLDFKSRYDLILLVAENLGEKPAFNIKFEWKQKLANHKGEEIRFNKYDDSIDIPVLNPKENTSLIIDLASRFYENRKTENLDFNGTIKFQESLNSKRKTSYPFHFSFKHYGMSPSFENEEPKTMYELQKIPEKLENIKLEIKKIIDKKTSP
ncbi:hypothetical protein [Sunxiuqinia rutila]|uniref:hypothetical protein n=1 Tax=Sunxiuqinia rutila TaxID=1397841 RepID=UPI003D36385D